MTETMLERVRNRLRDECRKEFGSTWNLDVADKFARAALEALLEPTDAMFRAGVEEPSSSIGPTLAAYKAMINAALEGH